MKMLLLDVKNNEIKTVEANSLEDYYNLIGCRCVDIIHRMIGDVEVEIVCDDEGMLGDNPKISAVDSTGNPVLCGNLLVASGRVTDDGELTELTPEELEKIMFFVAEVTTHTYKKPYRIFVEVDY